ncbi:unnamed protein product, partial [Meganyctiphanes norvegica]
ISLGKASACIAHIKLIFAASWKSEDPHRAIMVSSLRSPFKLKNLKTEPVVFISLVSFENLSKDTRGPKGCLIPPSEVLMTKFLLLSLKQPKSLEGQLMSELLIQSGP